MSKEMQVFVKTITGRVCIVKTKAEDTIDEFLLKVKEKVSSNQFNEHYVIFQGKIITEQSNGNKKMVSDYQIQNESTIQVVGRLKGGL